MTEQNKELFKEFIEFCDSQPKHTEIDFSKAPEGATHLDRENAVWYRIYSTDYYFIWNYPLSYWVILRCDASILKKDLLLVPTNKFQLGEN